jgi:hypothetical protein
VLRRFSVLVVFAQHLFLLCRSLGGGKGSTRVTKEKKPKKGQGGGGGGGGFGGGGGGFRR